MQTSAEVDPRSQGAKVLTQSIFHFGPEKHCALDFHKFLTTLLFLPDEEKSET